MKMDNFFEENNIKESKSVTFQKIINGKGVEKLLLTPQAISELSARQAVTCEQVDGETFITACWNGFYCLVNVVWRDFGNVHPVTIVSQSDFESMGMTTKEFLDAITKIRKFTTAEIDNTHNLIPRKMIYTIFTLTLKVLLNQVIYGHYWCLMKKEKRALNDQLLEHHAAGRISSQHMRDAKQNYDSMWKWLDEFVNICIEKMKLTGLPTEPIDYDTDDIVMPNSGEHFHIREGIKRNLKLWYGLKLFENLPEQHGLGGILDINFEIKDKTKCKCCGFREETCGKAKPNCVFCNKACENEFGNSVRGAGVGVGRVRVFGQDTIVNEDTDVCCNVCNVLVINARMRKAEMKNEKTIEETKKRKQAADQAEAELLAALDAEPKPVKAEKKKEKKVNKFACPCGDKNCMPRPAKTAWVNGVKRDQSFLQRAWDSKHNSSGKHSDSSSDI